MKRFLCLVLAALLCGTVFFAAGCDDGTSAQGPNDSQSNVGDDKDQSGDNGNNDNNNDDHDDTGDDDDPNDADDKGGKDDNGDVSADEGTLRRRLVANLLGADMTNGAVRLTAENLSLKKENAEKKGGTYRAEGYFRQTETELCADLYGTHGGSEEGYTLAFIRDGGLYRDARSWQAANVDEGDYDALLSAYSSPESGLSFTVRSITADDGTVMTIPVSLAVKLAMNIPDLTGGMTLKTTEDGYRLSFDPVKAFKMVASSLYIVSRRTNADTTLNSFLSNPFVDMALKTLFRGVMASEITTLPFFRDFRSYIAAPRDKDFYTYLKDAVSSEEYYDFLPIKKVLRTERACLGELTMQDLFTLAGLTKDEEGNELTGQELTARVDQLIGKNRLTLTTLSLDPIGGLFGMLYPTAGLSFTGSADVEFALTFGKDEKFKEMTLDVSSFKCESKDGATAYAGDLFAVFTFENSHIYADIGNVDRKTEA